MEQESFEFKAHKMRLLKNIFSKFNQRNSIDYSSAIETSNLLQLEKVVCGFTSNRRVLFLFEQKPHKIEKKQNQHESKINRFSFFLNIAA